MLPMSSLGLYSYVVLSLQLLLCRRTGPCPALVVLDDVVLLLMLRTCRRPPRPTTPPGDVRPQLPAPTFVGRSPPVLFLFLGVSYILVCVYVFLLYMRSFLFSCLYLVFLSLFMSFSLSMPALTLLFIL